MRRAGMLFGIFIAMTGRAALAQAPTPAPAPPVAAPAPVVGGAPAAPSHYRVLQAIDRAAQALTTPATGATEYAAGWNEFLSSLRSQLAAHATANSLADRSGPLNKLAQYDQALAVTPWAPAGEIHQALNAWLIPRLRLSAAVQSLKQVVGASAVSPEDATNRQGWNNFVETRLETALRAYESAQTVQARQAAVAQVQAAIGALDQSAYAWSPSIELSQSVRSLYRFPNLDVAVDPNTLSQFLARELVQTGPVYRKGYVSQVTAGPYLGFGLMSSDEGIAFFNRQAFSSYTPIHDFQQKLMQDNRGRKVAKLYYFSAASTDAPTLTVSSILSPSGLRLFSDYDHRVDALIGSAQLPGHGLQRVVLGAIGLNQPKLRQKIYENGIGEIRSNVVTEAAQESAERMAAAEAEQNAKLANVFVGNRTAVVQNKVQVTDLDMRSRPQFALVGGNLGWYGTGNQLAADLPQPPQLQTVESGVTADVHLGSILSNMARGFWQTPDAQKVQNLLVEVRPVAPGQPPSSGITVKQNATFADFSAAIDRARAANNPKATAIWVKRPSSPPTFATDARGYLVALVSDFQMDVQVPAQFASMANNARAFRLQSPLAEFVLDVKVKPNAANPQALELNGAVREFHGGPQGRVLAITNAEADAKPIDGFRGVLIQQGFGRALASQPINAPLNNLKMPGFAISSVSDLDPSGWMRVVLARTAEQPAPAAPAAPTPAPATPAPSPVAQPAPQPEAVPVAAR